MLAQMTWSIWLIAMLVMGVCGFLILIILIQRGRGSGMAGAFGGGGGGGGAFGAKTGDVLTWVTVVVAGIFLLLAVVANYAFDQSPEAAARTAQLPQAGDTGPGATPTTVPLIPAGRQEPPVPDSQAGGDGSNETKTPDEGGTPPPGA